MHNAGCVTDMKDMLGSKRENIVSLRYVPLLYIVCKGPHGLFDQALQQMAEAEQTGIKNLNAICEQLWNKWMKEDENVRLDLKLYAATNELLCYNRPKKPRP